MTVLPESAKEQRGGMLRTFGLMICHFLAISIFFFVPVFIFPTVSNRFETLGIISTPLFFWAQFISNIFSGYKFLFWILTGVQLYIIFRLARSGSKWLSPYSHSVLLLMSFLGMFFVAWMINPLVFVAPNLNAGPNADKGSPNSMDSIAILTNAKANHPMQVRTGNGLETSG